jgi:hypothetical protein
VPAGDWPSTVQRAPRPADSEPDDEVQSTQMISPEERQRAEEARRRAAQEQQQSWANHGPQDWPQ